ncbi:flagellar protein FlaG [Phosphitispora sp. TUW77]|uniref:flagellar protein FlaG n=1 Tax=Phosphitispora sp. TUW77 TaxID=3152361 RepID=UPI003AB2AC82
MKVKPLEGNSNTVNTGSKVQNTDIVSDVKPDYVQSRNRQVSKEKEADPKVLLQKDREADEQVVLQEAMEKLNEMTRIFDRTFHFEIHEETKRWIVQVVNTETGDVVKEIPPEKFLDMVARIDQFVGLLIDERR